MLHSEVGSTNLVELMRLFSTSGVVRAHFEETRWISLLAQPIETRGVVYFAPPDRLMRDTEHPGRSRVVVDGTRVAFEDETGHRVMDLGSSGVAQALTGSLMVLLRGDIAELHERYRVSFRSPENGWRLDLEPRSRKVRALIAVTTFRGRGASLLSMETVETNGDRTLALLRDVETRVELDAAELDKLFSLAPASGREQ